MPLMGVDDWLADLGADKDCDAHQQVAAALAMIDDYEADKDCPALASSVASVGGSFVADCTDTASENGSVSSSSNRSSSRASSSVSLRNGRSATELQSKAAARIAKKNQARLCRYHRARADLVGLRQEAARLQAQLGALLRKEASLPPATLATSPCPFVDDPRDEIDSKEHGRPIAAQLSARRCEVNWEDVASRERKRLQRSQDIRRKLKSLLREYAACTKQPHLTVDKRVLPSLPGADSLEAFTYSGVAMLSELYHMACKACSITPAVSVMLSKSGGELAYSFLLGKEIESGWTHDFSFPGDDPSSIAAFMIRVIRSQQPQNYVVRETLKDHGTDHPLMERRFTMRHQGARGASVNLECTMLMQTFNTDDTSVVVWTLSVHSGDSSSPPVFRASGWSAFQRSHPGQVSCRSRARVHCTPSHTLTRVEKMVKRQPMIDAWSKAIRKKQEVMSNRMLLVL